MSEFTDEDRALLDCWVEDKMLAREQMIPEERAALRAALAHIDHVEQALASLADEFDHIRVAVELERDEAADDENWRWAARLDGVVATWLHAAELARAALKGGENG